ncbi:energy transducer TonB [Parafilimonas sp.]|uniref:energy transducer TonB n=1 Tax=Parafilimonas sp. TaxID=1969739 RepID=UPI0039E5FB2E
MKLLSALLLLTAISAGTRSSAQPPSFLNLRLSSKVSLQTALIKINNKPATYTDLLKIADTGILKVEVYSKKAALEFVDKNEAKNGLVLVTLHKKHFPVYAQKKDGAAFVTNEKGDTMFCKNLVPPAINGDTSSAEWNRFLMQKLNPQAPADNSSPAGIYYVDIMFTVNTDGSIANLTVLEDPGYGTAAEVRKLMSQSPAWKTGLCDEMPVKFYQRQRITFVVTER